LYEHYGPGTVRSASGGDTRLSRVAHDEEHWSAEMARAARSRWLELEQETGMRIWEPVGLAWFARRADGFEARSRASLDQLGVPYEWLAPEEARGLFPSLSVDDLAAVLYEREAGVLDRRAGDPAPRRAGRAGGRRGGAAPQS
jgi:glycine/D-amino acid oxidase-like deaminating enzyme